jgi:hypothetical protein
VLLVRKPWSRKKPAPTITYVAANLGQRRIATAQSMMIIPVATSAEEESGKNSARIIPNPAIAAKPTNG